MGLVISWRIRGSASPGTEQPQRSWASTKGSGLSKPCYCHPGTHAPCARRQQLTCWWTKEEKLCPRMCQSRRGAILVPVLKAEWMAGPGLPDDRQQKPERLHIHTQALLYTPAKRNVYPLYFLPLLIKHSCFFCLQTSHSVCLPSEVVVPILGRMLESSRSFEPSLYPVPVTSEHLKTGPSHQYFFKLPT